MIGTNSNAIPRYDAVLRSNNKLHSHSRYHRNITYKSLQRGSARPLFLIRSLQQKSPAINTFSSCSKARLDETRAIISLLPSLSLPSSLLISYSQYKGPCTQLCDRTHYDLMVCHWARAILSMIWLVSEVLGGRADQMVVIWAPETWTQLTCMDAFGEEAAMSCVNVSLKDNKSIIHSGKKTKKDIFKGISNIHAQMYNSIDYNL